MLRGVERMAVNPTQLIEDARAGHEAALGSLLDLYRNYLHLLADREIGRRLQAKLDASDLVQETLLEAQLKFRLFHGADEPQFVEWLRRILATKVANLVRHYCGTKMRDVRLEQEIDLAFDHSTRMSHGLAASLVTASEQAARREEAVILADALAQLPEDYQEVIKLRHFEGLTFPEIARTLERTLDSVDKLWLRALTRLRQIVGESG